VAVDDVSFEVSRGEIVGFLGPNGAGKTTTMRMLTGYLPATGGDVEVAGRDVFTESREVRKRIGYLPESCPLYPDMRVQEYLGYRGRLKGLGGKHLRKRVAAVVEQCSLGDVQRRIIGQLSKGYRQRVGLADALVHEPELLILDEPTIGLDPNQIRHVRDLIRDLASEHTILLSTHILPEVEMTCRRVLIINKGRIIASDSPTTLRARMEGGGQVVADVRGPEDQIREGLAGLSGAVAVDLENRNDWLLCRVDCEEGTDLRADLFNLAATRGWALRELRMEHTSLEEVFVSLTKKGARTS
jgi:ABC-2 type transport system ATP-binding protein